MRGKLKYAVGVLLIGVVVGAFYASSPQKTLARRVREADRVVATHPREDFSITITGLDVQKIVGALATGKKESPFIKAGIGLRLEFFKGSKHLDTVRMSGQVFWIGNTPYSDVTDTLQELWPRYREEQLLREVR